MLLGSLLATAAVMAGTQPWVGDYGHTETVEQIMLRQALTPSNPANIARMQEHEDETLEALAERNFSEDGQGALPAFKPERNVALGPNGTTITLGSTAPYVPPDTMGAVGPTQILVSVNGRFRTYNKSTLVADGALNVTPEVFFNSVGGASGMSDPRARFDRLTNRWFIVMINLASTNNNICIAVSSGPTITASTSFTFYGFNFATVTPTSATDTGAFFDYPTFGLDANALYIGGNVFGASFNGCTGFVVRKSSVLTGGPLVATAFRQIANSSAAGVYTPMGVDNDDPASTDGYFIGIDFATGRLGIRRISNPGGTPTINALQTVAVNTLASPIDVACLGSTLPPDTLDLRLFSASMRLNRLTGTRSIWCSHNIRANSAGAGSGSGDRIGSRWYQISFSGTTPSLTQQGMVYGTAATGFDNFTIPSVVMSGQGHACLSSTYFNSATRRLSSQASFRFSSDTLGAMQTPTSIFEATANYNAESSPATSQRWGDYSITVVDPMDDMTFWAFTEVCSSANTWGVRVTQIRAPQPAVIISVSPSSIAQGATANITVTGSAAGGAEGFFDPGAPDSVSSTPWNRLAAAFSGTGLTVNSVTFTSPTSITLNVTASASATAGARDLTVTNPDGQTRTASAILTVTSGSNPTPTITTLSPNSAIVGSSAVTVTVNGTGFIPSSVVNWNGSARTTTYVSASSVTFVATSTDLATAGSVPITVTNPAPGGGTSGSVNFSVNNPTPAITALSPSSAIAGGAGFSMTITGSGFVSGCSATLGSNPLTVTTVNPTSIIVNVPAAAIATAGSLNVVVTNPAPGGGLSAPAVFTVNNPVPVLSTITPNSAILNSTPTTIQVVGSGFVPTSKVKFNGVVMATSYVNSTTLNATPTASMLQTAGVFPIVVETTDFVGGTSSSLSFTVNNPTPVISSLAPSSVTAGASTTTVVIAGSGFISSSSVTFDGAPVTVTFVSQSTLQVSIPATLLTTAGLRNVVVTNPPTGGGASNVSVFTVNNPLPVITSVSPNTIQTLSPTTNITITGTGFNAGSQVKWNTTNLGVISTTSTSIVATVPSSLLTTASTALVTVVNPSPGGGTSNAQGVAVVSSQLTGTIDTGLGDSSGISGVLQIRNVGSTAALLSVPFTLNSSGGYNVSFDLAPGSYDVACEIIPHWLRRVQSKLAITSPSTTGVNFVLINGDVDGDNTVSVLDYLKISAYFEAQDTDSNWNTADGDGISPKMCDLDHDGFVSILDYLIVSSAYDSLGDD